MADEQTSLSQVRKQYLQLLDDQQKKYADDLSKLANKNNAHVIIIIIIIIIGHLKILRELDENT